MRLALFILSHVLIRNAHNGIFHTVISGNLRVIRFFILRRRKGCIYKKRGKQSDDQKTQYKKCAAYKVETQNFASHKLETLLQHADYNRNLLRIPPRETQDFATLLAYAIVIAQHYSHFYCAAC